MESIEREIARQLFGATKLIEVKGQASHVNCEHGKKGFNPFGTPWKETREFKRIDLMMQWHRDVNGLIHSRYIGHCNICSTAYWRK